MAEVVKERVAGSGSSDVEQVVSAAMMRFTLSFTPFTLAFRDIKYYVAKPGGKV